MENKNSNQELFKKLNWYATQKGYSLRDTQTLLEIDGFKRPTLYFVRKWFKSFRGKHIKKV